MRWRQFLLAALLALAFPAAAGTATGKPGARCARLAGQIAEVHLKMRMGYTAKQGRLYRQKLAVLEAEQRALCRKGPGVPSESG